MSQSQAVPPEATAPRKKRVESIDAFRGFTIWGMIFVIMVAGYKNLPLTFPHFGSAPVSTWKHAGEDGDAGEWAFWEGQHPSKQYRPGKVMAADGYTSYTVAVADDENSTPTFTTSAARIWAAKPLHPGESIIAVQRKPADPIYFQGVGNGCTFTDLVAPFFVFIVGLCIPLSKQRRGGAWWKHVGARTLGLILLGVVYISLILKVSYWWGILQAIGVAYFMGAASMRFPAVGRWVAVVVIGAFHAWATFHIPWWVELGDKSRPFWTILNPSGDPLRPLTVHCTPWASISYGLLTIIGTLLGDAVATRDTRIITRQSLLVGVVFTVVGYILHRVQAPMNKDYVSVSYSLFTAGIGALTFLAFYWVIDVWGLRRWAWPLNVYGANALLAYFLQPVVRIFLSALGVYDGLKGHAGWEGMLAGFEWTLLLWCVTLWCNRKGIYWKL